jgi:hypothetical protein
VMTLQIHCSSPAGPVAAGGGGAVDLECHHPPARRMASLAVRRRDRRPLMRAAMAVVTGQLGTDRARSADGRWLVVTWVR